MRKPITAYAGGKGPRQRIWEAIRARAGLEFSRYQIARAADVEDSTVTTYLQALVKAEVIKVCRSERINNVTAETFYLLVRDEGLEAPRLRRDGSRVTQGLAQEQMWRTLRILNGDTNGRELAAHASTPGIPVAEAAARDYLLVLSKAGYLLCTQEGKGTGKGGILARYRLKPGRNTGPRPPMVCRTRAVYDPNEDKVVWAKPVTEEDAIYA